MPQLDYKLLVHGTTGFTVGAVIGAAGPQISENVIDFGYTTPNAGAGNNLGLHVEVMVTFTDLTYVNVGILTGSTNPPATTIAVRQLLLASLAAGKHYFIPAPPPCQEYLAAYWAQIGTSPTAGKVLMWFGPGKDGAM